MSRQDTIIETLYSECDGYLELRALGKRKDQGFFKILDSRAINAFIRTNRDSDLYFAVATRDGKSGKKDSIVSIPALWCDIDFKEIEQSEVEKRLDVFPFQPTVRVSSGGGMHLYWKLREPSDKSEIEQVESALRWIAVTLGGDMASTDASRILRVPNTKNHKYKPPRPVILQHCNGTTFNLSDFLELVPHDTAQSDTSNVIQFKPLMDDGLKAIMACKFMQHCRDDASKLSEAEWFFMVRQLCKEPGGVALIHKLSKPYPGYTKAETDTKILHSLNDTAGPCSCGTIRKHFDCGMDCGVRAPAALRFVANDDVDPPITDDTDQTYSGNHGNQRNHGNHCQHGIHGSTSSSSVIIGNHPSSSVIIGNQVEQQKVEGGLTAQLREWIKDSIGSFTTADVDREFNLRTRAEKVSRARACNILIKENKISKDRAIRGKFHILDDSVQWIDLNADVTPSFDAEFPLGISDMVTIPPKSIVVVAGATNAGKTAFLLNVARLNLQGSAKQIYLMSEMGKSEYLTRLARFSPEVRYDSWLSMNAAERSCGFNSVIWHHNRDGITYVDFLEDIGGEYFKLASGIREIYDALGEGIAVIALQKKKEQDYGRGGEATAEKARLYISIDVLCQCNGFSICSAKIVKAKDYRCESNPNGKECHFKLIKGAHMMPINASTFQWRWVTDKERQGLVAKYLAQFGTRD